MAPLPPRFWSSLCSKSRRNRSLTSQKKQKRFNTEGTENPEKRKKRRKSSAFLRGLRALCVEFLSVPIRCRSTPGLSALRRGLRLFRMKQRHRDQMFGEEPNLQFIRPDDVTHDQVVRSIVAAVRSLPRHGTRFFQ